MKLQKNIKELRRRARAIKLLATDLDGTLLNRKHELTEENRVALERLAKSGVILVAATGRSRTSIPETVTKLRGLKYLITANGAKIFSNETNAILYEKYLSADALDYVRPLLSDAEILCEAFWDGKPHVDEARYKGAAKYGIPFWFNDYFLSSRIPVNDFEKTLFKHKDEIENINFVFPDDLVKERVRKTLDARKDLYELTTSLVFNFEIGGIGVSKAAALDFIAKREKVLSEEIISFGDNENDMSMIEYAGIGVAIGNAVPNVLAVSDLVTEDNEHDGVAAAVKSLFVE